MDEHKPNFIETLGDLQMSIDNAVTESDSARTELSTVRSELEGERWWRRLLVKCVLGLFGIIMVLCLFIVFNQLATQSTARNARQRTFDDLSAIEKDLAASKLSQEQIHQIAVEIQMATSPQAKAQGNAQTAVAVHQLEDYVHAALQAAEEHQSIPEPPPLATGG